MRYLLNIDPLRRNYLQLTRILGLSGSMIIIMASLVSAIGYEGKAGEAYSFLNHFISELGEVSVSNLAWIFNWGMIIGGGCLTFFLILLGVYGRHWFAYFCAFLGAGAGVAAVFVGIFPMDTLDLHKTAALIFFRLGLITVFLWTLFILFDDTHKFSKWLAIPGALSAVAFFVFLNIPQYLPPGQGFRIFLEADFVRPAFWLTPFLEWLIFFLVLLWVICAALDVFQRGSGHPARKKGKKKPKWIPLNK
jgi:hypothetical membrane protein